MASIDRKNMKPIELYTAATMNGFKASIILEELQLPYNVHYLKFDKKEQKQEWYLKINPNGRIPAIVDPNNNNLSLAESGAILVYLCEQYDPNNAYDLYVSKNASSKEEISRKYSIWQWIMFQMSGIGPILGNTMYFQRIAKPKGIEDEFAIKRFTDESYRLLGVIERQLASDGGRPYITGNRFSIADICLYTYVKSSYWACLSLDDFPKIRGWLERIDARPAVKKGLTIPAARPQFYGPVKDMEKAIAKNAAAFDIPNTSKL